MAATKDEQPISPKRQQLAQQGGRLLVKCKGDFERAAAALGVRVATLRKMLDIIDWNTVHPPFVGKSRGDVIAYYRWKHNPPRTPDEIDHAIIEAVGATDEWRWPGAADTPQERQAAADRVIARRKRRARIKFQDSGLRRLTIHDDESERWHRRAEEARRNDSHLDPENIEH